MSEWRRRKLELDATRTTSKLGFKADKKATIILSVANKYGAIDDWTSDEDRTHDYYRVHRFCIHWDSFHKSYYFPDLDYYLEPPYFGSDYMLIDIAKEFQLSFSDMYILINDALEHEGLPLYPIEGTDLARFIECKRELTKKCSEDRSEETLCSGDDFERALMESLLHDQIGEEP